MFFAALSLLCIIANASGRQKQGRSGNQADRLMINTYYTTYDADGRPTHLVQLQFTLCGPLINTKYPQPWHLTPPPSESALHTSGLCGKHAYSQFPWGRANCALSSPAALELQGFHTIMLLEPLFSVNICWCWSILWCNTIMLVAMVT